MEKKPKDEHSEEDVSEESINHLIEHRIPWLLIGLLGGLLATLIVSKYEEILASDVRVAFFIPIIVYLSDAVGTQTETIYVRALSNSRKNISFAKYILKESLVGMGLGLISGTILGVFATYWLKSSARVRLISIVSPIVIPIAEDLSQ